MFKAHLVLTALLALCALAFGVCGSYPLANIVDYSAISDRQGFNRFVAVRMLLPVVVAVLCSGVSYIHPSLAVPLLFTVPLSVLCVGVWVTIGSARFAK